MSKIELKACPFCGGKPETGPWQKHGLTVQCSSSLTDCPVNPGYSHYEPAGAIAAWNARAPQWQPISSAPKDGTTFLAGEFYFADGACVYKECSTAFRNKDGRVYCHDENIVPTHWQPLPAAPEVPK